jgi:hypothetical protein
VCDDRADTAKPSAPSPTSPISRNLRPRSKEYRPVPNFEMRRTQLSMYGLHRSIRACSDLPNQCFIALRLAATWQTWECPRREGRHQSTYLGAKVPADKALHRTNCSGHRRPPLRPFKEEAVSSRDQRVMEPLRINLSFRNRPQQPAHQKTPDRCETLRTECASVRSFWIT